MSRSATLEAFAFAVLSSFSFAGGLVRGVVVDETDGAALPYYEIEVRAGETAEKVTSDAQGRFATARAFDAGTLLVQGIDCAALERSTYVGNVEVSRLLVAPKKVEFDPAKEVTVPVIVGPTYRLALAPMPPRLPDGAFARLWAEPIGGVGDVWSVVAPLRTEGGGVWARFSSFPQYIAQASSSWRLGVEAPSGLWSGSIAVTSLRGAQSGALEIGMTERARWRGTLRGAKGAGVPRVWLTLARLGDVGQTLSTTTQACDWEGGFAFANLEPGTYRLSGAPLRHREFASQPKKLAALEDAKFDMTLDPLKSVGAIAGRLDSRSGTFSSAQGSIALELRRAGDGVVLERKTPEWKDVDGKKVAPFSFDDLPAGDYEIDVRAPNTVPFEPATRAAKAPNSELVFTAQDA